jgi:N-acetylglutamate synthase-like GNAT family acetyltransferase
VAEEDGRAVGWAALIPRAEVGWLEDLWVEPDWIGKGIGRQIFERVAAEAKARGARRLEWEAEPNATGFYAHMGGTYVRDSEETEWGRVLEVLGVTLA